MSQLVVMKYFMHLSIGEYSTIACIIEFLYLRPSNPLVKVFLIVVNLCMQKPCFSRKVRGRQRCICEKSLASELGLLGNSSRDHRFHC